MSKGAHNIFALVVNFLRVDQQPKMSLSNSSKRMKQLSKLLQRIWLLDTYGLRKQILAYVNDEGFNFNNMINALKSIVDCKASIIEESYYGTCFEHALWKIVFLKTTLPCK